MSDGAARSGRDRQSRIDFIRNNTTLLTPALLPEIKLHLADESLPIWEKTEIELDEVNLPPPFWAFAWVGGQALARYVLDNPETARGKRVLDLGSGSGLVAVAVMRAGAAYACAADIDAYSAVAASLNADVNGIRIDTTETDLLDTTPDGFDMVLVGDLFYERGMSERVLAFMERADHAGAVVMVGDPRRSYFPTHRFEPVAEYDVATSRELEDQDIKRAQVWRFKRSGDA